MKEKVLELDKITKDFPGVRALDNAKLNVYRGSVMALVGENGAGKSTLMKIIGGIYVRDEGRIIYKGNEVNFKTPKQSQDAGIAVIHQELNLISQLTAGENIFLGHEFTDKSGRIKWKKTFIEAEKLLKKLGVGFDSKAIIGNLSIGEQQMVEIAKAVSQNAEIIIMDEPTDALTEKETNALFKVIKELKKEGKSIIYISHRLVEISQICDYITIMRDGKFISENNVSDIDENYIVEKMVGRKLEEQFPYIKVVKGKEVFRIAGLSNEFIDNATLKICEGEVLGIAGLIGAGRTELAKTIYGIYRAKRGDVYIDGKKSRINSPKEALNYGIVYVSEDRKKDGLVLGLSVRENMTLSSVEKYEKLFLKIDGKKETMDVENYVNKFRIKTPGINQIIKNLSGGNQQKVSIAKGLLRNPKLLILDEPTRGVDVGAKKEIYDFINLMKKDGLSIIMISSEMPEVMGLCDRVMVMHNGKITGEIARKDVTQEKIMKYAMGIGEGV